MGIIDNQLASRFGNKGQKPFYTPESKTSTLHNSSSINGMPNIKRKPSNLDLNGKTPKKYTDNLPK